MTALTPLIFSGSTLPIFSIACLTFGMLIFPPKDDYGMLLQCGPGFFDRTWPIATFIIAMMNAYVNQALAWAVGPTG
jgi:hypothetical protein